MGFKLLLTLGTFFREKESRDFNFLDRLVFIESSGSKETSALGVVEVFIGGGTNNPRDRADRTDLKEACFMEEPVCLIPGDLFDLGVGLSLILPEFSRISVTSMFS